MFSVMVIRSHIHNLMDLKLHCEIIWIQLSTTDGLFLFGIFYHLINSRISTLEELILAVSSAPGGFPIGLCRDFNAPDID